MDTDPAPADPQPIARLPAEVRDLLDAPNYVHLATLRTDGSPRSHVVWVARWTRC